MSGGGAVLARRIYRWLSPETTTWSARLFRLVHHALVAAGLVAVVLDTVSSIHSRLGAELTLVFDTALAFLVIEYGLRFWTAPEALWAVPGHAWRARWQWLGSGAGLIDFLALLPLAALLAGAPPAVAHDIGMLWILKFGRYSEGLGLVARVLQ